MLSTATTFVALWVVMAILLLMVRPAGANDEKASTRGRFVLDPYTDASGVSKAADAFRGSETSNTTEVAELAGASDETDGTEVTEVSTLPDTSEVANVSNETGTSEESEAFSLTDASDVIETSNGIKSSNGNDASVVIKTFDGTGASNITGVSDVTGAYDASNVTGDWETGSCVLDTSGDEELLRDPRWLCAVARARCLAKHRNRNRSVTECGPEICNNLQENSTVIYVRMMDDLQTLMPKLFCRTTSKLVWHWETPDPQIKLSIIFVVSVRQCDQDSWLLHETVTEEQYTIDKLPSGTEFLIRVQPVAEDGIIPGSCMSKRIPTLNDTFNPLQVRNVTVAEEYDFSEDHVNMSIQWEPNEVDMMCDYIVLYWDVYDNNLPHQIDSDKFSAKLFNLHFNGSYRAFVISGDRDNELWGSEKADVNITTPPCLDVWNNDINICSPPPPVNTQITFLKVGESHYMNISWIPAKIIPERYNVTMEGFMHLRKIEENKVVDGNATSVIFKNAKPEIFYRGCVSTMSSGGNSIPNCVYRKFRAQVKRKVDINNKVEFGEMTIVIIVSLTILCMIMLITLIIYNHFNKKQKENVRRCEYFKNLKNETPIEKTCESSALYFDDEWEISEDRLVVSDHLGRGAFGIVHKGILLGKTHLEPDIKVAIKTLRDDSNAEDLYEFRKEIAMMKSVGSHPHIVPIIGCCTHSKQIRLIVEYCALGDLQKYLQKNAARYAQNVNRSQDKPTERIKYAELMSAKTGEDVDYKCHRETNIAVNQMYFENCVETKPKMGTSQQCDLLSFARQIAMGMEFLAHNRIIHRDLAARNVLVCSNKTVKISDFGLSRDIYEQNVYRKTGPGKLPIQWTAFESLKNQTYTTKSDVWSFGILLWEISTLGEMPYPGIPAREIFRYLRKGNRMECPPNCSQELYEIMSSCWREKPEHRPTFTELRYKLDCLLETTSPQQYLSLSITDVECPEESLTNDLRGGNK